MALTITDTVIISDEIDAVAEYRPHAAADGTGAWVVTYGDRLDPVPAYYGRLFSRNQAISAMMAAQERARPEPDWVRIRAWESELS